jgi:arylsulfatase A-like enzyme
VPLLKGDQVVERPADQHTLTRRYAEEGVKFMRSNKEKPFLLYFASTMPHVPLFASDAFDGKSARGTYGDVVEELDWAVGRILDALRTEGLDKKTLVVFTSDNGPWLVQGDLGGSAGLLQEGKGSTWEGGVREPGIFWWPGRIAAGSVTQELGCTMDLFTTSIRLAGGEIPKDRPIDGIDLSSVLFGQGPGLRQSFVYYRDTSVYAIRKGRYKAHVVTRSGYGKDPAARHDPPLLFDLGVDPGEKYDVAKSHPDVLADLVKSLAEFEAGMTPGENQLEK